MGRQPCCDKVGLKKGPWTAEEDKKLINFILTNGQCCWRAVPKLAGLLRCGKSCRLRWTNYLRPDLKRGLLSEYEEKMVIDLHSQLGNRWSKIASHLSGRTDNEIKNYWNTHIKKKLKKMGIDPITHKPLTSSEQQQSLPQEQVQPQQNEEEHQNQNCSIDIAKSEVDQNYKDQETLSMELSNSNDGFCINEVPMIEPHEILVPSEVTTSSSTTSSSSYDSNNNNNGFFDDLQYFSDFEWPNNVDVDLWGADHQDLISNAWNFLMNDDVDSDQTMLMSAPSRNVVLDDKDSWTFGLL